MSDVPAKLSPVEWQRTLLAHVPDAAQRAAYSRGEAPLVIDGKRYQPTAWAGTPEWKAAQAEVAAHDAEYVNGIFAGLSDEAAHQRAIDTLAYKRAGAEREEAARVAAANAPLTASDELAAHIAKAAAPTAAEDGTPEPLPTGCASAELAARLDDFDFEPTRPAYDPDNYDD